MRSTLFLLFLLPVVYVFSSEENFLLINGNTDEVLLEIGPHVDKRISPCSTFKVPLSLMGFDAGILLDEKTPAWDFQEGYIYWAPAYKTTPQTPKSWMTYCPIWYSKVLSLELGLEKIERYLESMEYGNKDLSLGLSGPEDEQVAWINSTLQISPREQVDFIRKMIQGRLPISNHAIEMTKAIIYKEQLPNGWILLGKTGWSGSDITQDGISLEHRWFVGWVERGPHFFPFAYLIRDRKIDLGQAIPRVKQLLMESDLMTATEETNLSHATRNTLEGAIEEIGAKIRQRGDLPYVTAERQLELLEELSEFELGRFILQRGGLNGYWTDYVISHPYKSHQPFNPLERFLLEQAPTILATQERFEIFKREIQNRLCDGASLASIPCGLTADLLDLDFSQVVDFRIFGIDIDLESLAESKKIAEELSLMAHCQFVQRDAWALGYENQFDVIASNGLSMYEPDNQKVVDLYRQFFLALKPNGCLVTSFLTPPPIPGKETQWDLQSVNSEHALLQKIVFADILDCKWQIYRSEALVRSQLLEAGFTEIEVYYDKAHIFPTLVAKKFG